LFPLSFFFTPFLCCSGFTYDDLKAQNLPLAEIFNYVKDALDLKKVLLCLVTSLITFSYPPLQQAMLERREADRKEAERVAAEAEVKAREEEERQQKELENNPDADPDA
jgi:hypothetical protein